MDHLQAVSVIARGMAACAGFNNNVQQCCGIAGYLHDIGKATSIGHQAESMERPTHHEIGWAYLAGYLRPTAIKELILDAVYWHHAQVMRGSLFSLLTQECILKCLTDNDRQAMKSVVASCRTVLGDVSLGLLSYPNLGMNPPPFFRALDVPGPSSLSSSRGRYPHYDEGNALRMAVRACVCSANRIASSLEDSQLRDLLIGSLSPEYLVESEMGKMPQASVSCPEDYDPERFEMQQQCVSNALQAAGLAGGCPAGFGKTLVGLMWGQSHGRRLLWVCPRNEVAYAVFANINKELEALGLDGKISVEVNLTGQRQEATQEDVDELGSDIVITNIDTFVRPMVDHQMAGRTFKFLTAPVVFDEFHEYIAATPLFAAFVTLMLVRHRWCRKVPSLLLSATPTSVADLWDCEEKPVLHLPSRNEHYPPQHQGTYRLSLADKQPDSIEGGGLCILNSVRQSQYAYRRYQPDLLLHSRFIDADRRRNLSRVMKSFGKEGNGVKNGETVVSALMAQAVLDISFAHLYESVCSPESTLQRIGRVDRWGTYWHMSPTICLFRHRFDRHAIQTIYDNKLHQAWWDFLREKHPGDETAEVGLSTLYGYYNEFYRGDAGGSIGMLLFPSVLFYFAAGMAAKIIKHLRSRGAVD